MDGPNGLLPFDVSTFFLFLFPNLICSLYISWLGLFMTYLFPSFPLFCLLSICPLSHIQPCNKIRNRTQWSFPTSSHRDFRLFWPLSRGVIGYCSAISSNKPLHLYKMLFKGAAFNRLCIMTRLASFQRSSRIWGLIAMSQITNMLNPCWSSEMQVIQSDTFLVGLKHW